MTNLLLPSGLTYITEFISPEVEQTLVEKIDQSPWVSDLKRRVQHYGYRYDYRARKVSPEDYLGDLPDWLNTTAEQLVSSGIFKVRPDQVIVNEYEPGQGIAPHVDCVPCFEDTIVSLSLLSGCEMNFKNTKNQQQELSLYLEPRSLIVLKDSARFEWTHGIKPRKSDLVQNARHQRLRRISLTFRRVAI